MPSRIEKGKYEFFVTCKNVQEDAIKAAAEELASLTDYMHILTTDGLEKTGKENLFLKFKDLKI